MAGAGLEPGLLFLQCSTSPCYWPVIIVTQGEVASPGAVSANTTFIRRLGYEPGEKGETRAESVVHLAPWGETLPENFPLMERSLLTAGQHKMRRAKLEAALRLAAALAKLPPSERPGALARYRADASTLVLEPMTIEAFLDSQRPPAPEGGASEAAGGAGGRPRRQAAAAKAAVQIEDPEASDADVKEEESASKPKSSSRAKASAGAGEAASAGAGSSDGAAKEWPPARLATELAETPEYAARLHSLGWVSFPSYPPWPVIVIPLVNASPEALVSYDASSTRDKLMLLNLGRGQDYSVFSAASVKPWAPGTPAHEAAVETGMKLMATIESSGRVASDKRSGWRQAYEEAVEQAARAPEARISVLPNERRVAWNAHIAAAAAVEDESLAGKRPSEGAAGEGQPPAKRPRLEESEAAVAAAVAAADAGAVGVLAASSSSAAAAPSSGPMITGTTDYLTRLLNKGLKRLNGASERRDCGAVEDTLRILGTISVTAAALTAVPIIPAVRAVAKAAPRWGDRPAPLTARVAEACGTLLAGWKAIVAAEVAAKAAAPPAPAPPAPTLTVQTSAAASGGGGAASAGSSSAGPSPAAAVVATPAKVAAELLADYTAIYTATGLGAVEQDHRMVARRTCADAVAAAVFGGLMQRPGVATALGGGGPSSTLLSFLMETLRGITQVAALGLETACVTKSGPLLPTRPGSSSAGPECVPGSEAYTNRLTALIGVVSTAFEEAGTEAGRSKPAPAAAEKLAARLEEGIGRCRRAAASLTQRGGAAFTSAAAPSASVEADPASAATAAAVSPAVAGAAGTSFEEVAAAVIAGAVPALTELARVLTPLLDARVSAWHHITASLTTS